MKRRTMKKRLARRRRFYATMIKQSSGIHDIATIIAQEREHDDPRSAADFKAQADEMLREFKAKGYIGDGPYDVPAFDVVNVEIGSVTHVQAGTVSVGDEADALWGRMRATNKVEPPAVIYPDGDGGVLMRTRTIAGEYVTTEVVDDDDG
jgi:hypothetical protein